MNNNYANVGQLQPTRASGGMVDTLDSGSSAGNGVEVRLLSRAPK
jgi:hypothetical protein